MMGNVFLKDEKEREKKNLLSFVKGLVVYDKAFLMSGGPPTSIAVSLCFREEEGGRERERLNIFAVFCTAQTCISGHFSFCCCSKLFLNGGEDLRKYFMSGRREH